jgi:hypothetical protein
LLDENGQFAGVLTINLLNHEASQLEGERCEVIEISQGFTPNPNCREELRNAQNTLDEWDDEKREIFGETYHFCNVFWIERIDGVVYRKALGRVFAEAWSKQKRDLIEVVLG